MLSQDVSLRGRALDTSYRCFSSYQLSLHPRSFLCTSRSINDISRLILSQQATQTSKTCVQGLCYSQIRQMAKDVPPLVACISRQVCFIWSSPTHRACVTLYLMRDAGSRGTVHEGMVNDTYKFKIKTCESQTSKFNTISYTSKVVATCLRIHLFKRSTSQKRVYNWYSAPKISF